MHLLYHYIWVQFTVEIYRWDSNIRGETGSYQFLHFHLHHRPFFCNSSCRVLTSTTCWQVIKTKLNVSLRLRDWLNKKKQHQKKQKKTTFISVHKDEAPLPRRSRSSGGRWRFNLAPDEWPIAALSEAAEAPAKCGGNKNNAQEPRRTENWLLDRAKRHPAHSCLHPLIWFSCRFKTLSKCANLNDVKMIKGRLSI